MDAQNCWKYLDKLDAKKFNISETIWNGTFAYRMYNESKDKAYVFVGAFFKDGSEADKLIENIQEVCFDGVDNCHYVVTGIDFDYTNKLADFFLDKVDFDADNSIVCSGRNRGSLLYRVCYW